jgi:hypothetical protein
MNRLHGAAHRAGWPELRDARSDLEAPFDRVQRDLAMTWRAARKGRNPATGAEIKIPASKVAKFSSGAKLKKAVNKK